MSHPNAYLVAMALAVCSAACEPADAPDTTVVRDSAGIRIVENVAPRWTPETAWRLSQEPVAHIGGIEGDPDQELYRVRGAIRLTNGNIVVVNAGTNELRFFTSDGSYLSSSGGQGDGPGEFRAASWAAQLAGDSLAAFDARHLRVSYFDQDGEFARSLLLRTSDEVPFLRVIGIFGDGALLVRVPTGTTAPRADGLHRSPDRLFRYSADGNAIDSVGWGAGREQLRYRLGTGSSLGIIPHFGRSSQYVVRDSLFYVATNDTYEIKVYSMVGTLLSVIRKRHENVPVTSGDIEVIQKQTEERFNRPGSNLSPSTRKIFEETPFHKTMPAFGSRSLERTFHVDAEDNVWVMEYNRPGHDQKRWTVFDEAGTLLGTTRVPDDLIIMDIGGDYVLGVERDEYDVEHVMMYGLVKP